MKQQYVGDINDYRKFALLRHLRAASGLKIGVCWMLTPPDDRSDGRKIDYLGNHVKWRGFAPEVFDALRPIARLTSATRLKHLERSKIVPGALYFDEYVPCHPDLRQAYFEVALSALKGAGIVFFDPDNGVEVRSVAKGKAASPKFLYRDEIAATYEAGYSVLIYQHYPREERKVFLSKLGRDVSRYA